MQKATYQALKGYREIVIKNGTVTIIFKKETFSHLQSVFRQLKITYECRDMFYIVKDAVSFLKIIENKISCLTFKCDNNSFYIGNVHLIEK